MRFSFILSIFREKLQKAIESVFVFRKQTIVVLTLIGLVMCSGCESNESAVLKDSPLSSNDIFAVMRHKYSVEDITTNYNENPAIKGVYKVEDGKTQVGYIYKALGSGYNGELLILVGVNMNNEIVSMKVMEHSETPGTGELVTKKTFLRQFNNNNLNSGFTLVKEKAKKRSDIETISGASISAQGIVDLINKVAVFQAREIYGATDPKDKPTVTVPNAPSNSNSSNTPKPTEESLSPTKVYNWIQARYEYYDNKYNNGQYSGDKYTSEVFSDAAVHFKTTVEKVRKAYDAFRY